MGRRKLISGGSAGRAILVAGLLAVWVGAAGAANMRFGNVVPGAGPINKPVVSMRERRYVDLVPQQTDFSCGAAALATVLRYAYGQDVSEQQVLQGLFTVSDVELVRERGFSLLDLKRYVESLGMRGRGYRVSGEKLDEVSIPTIVLLDLKGYKHFVVLKKTEGERVYLADPALGNKIMEREAFLSAWNGVIFAVIGGGFERDTVLLNPPEPLTARRLHDVIAPLTDAQLLEFGFTHADLF